MNDTTLASIKTWFSGYIAQLAAPDPVCQEAFALKQVHSEHVAALCKRIAESLKFNPEQKARAEACGILHDVGRFEQYRRYGTFADARSVNHACLGAEIIRTHEVLKDVSAKESEIMLFAICNHNKLAIETHPDAETIRFARILRDADKLDIFRITSAHYQQPQEQRNRSIDLDLPESPEFSQEICRELIAGNLIKMTLCKSANDFRLLQLGWIYDINFAFSAGHIGQNGFFEKLWGVLPKTALTQAAYQKVTEFLKIKSGEQA